MAKAAKKEVKVQKAPAPAEASTATAEQKAQTANIFKNIVNLLQHGMFFGHNAGYVAEAIGFLEANIKAIEGQLKPTEVPT
jgi:hypothetical protein